MKLVGKVREAHGLKGDLYVLIFSGDISWAKRMKSFGLKPKDSDEIRTFSVERTKPFKKGLIVKAAEIADRTAAEGVEHLEFFVDDDLFVSKPGETIFLSEIKNFKLKDPEQKLLGEIVDFSSNGVQDLLVVEAAGKKVEVPFVDAFIKKIDFKHQTVVMDLPEGLFDIENA
ncbi:ribosome maturation factor RimM [Bdellovibrio bacteriovorus]|uniref:Ribosome maturation factor RimM n=1 Tax=Bdellovibrio bacteriovorus TaxID=959 RepID=A0A150WDK0_BDEBC|nr:ribosome maturation factor RimM [Bdellovibrio bacteriovorus]KYG61144.1 ribosome maturation factor RimM [Bdellovibrio bacteriovorus]KYG65172.1 ribosome maturation factor RimM [Bdellovibrio bacteriovorus]